MPEIFCGLFVRHADRRQPEVGEDLVADPVLARVGGEAEREVRLDGVEPCSWSSYACSLFEQADPAALLRHVEERRRALRPRSGASAQLELLAAVAAQRVEDVAGEALGVDADEDVLGAVDVALARARRGACRSAARGRRPRWNSPKSVGSRTETTRSTSFSCARRYSIRSATVTIFSPWRSQYADEVGDAGHRPVVVHDLADDAGGMQPGEPREVDRRLGLARALEHAAAAGAEREDVARLDEVVRRRRAGRSRPGSSARGRRRRCPVETPSRASIETVKAVPNGVSFWSVIWSQPELVAALGGQARGRSARGRGSP